MKKSNRIRNREEKELLDKLKEWFAQSDLDSPNFLKRNNVAAYLRKEMYSRGRWKNHSSPRKHLKQWQFRPR